MSRKAAVSKTRKRFMKSSLSFQPSPDAQLKHYSTEDSDCSAIMAVSPDAGMVFSFLLRMK